MYDEQVTDNWLILVLWPCGAAHSEPAQMKRSVQELFVAFAYMSSTPAYSYVLSGSAI